MIDSIYLIKYKSEWDGSPWVILDDCTRGMYAGGNPITFHDFSMGEYPGKSVAVPMKIERI